MSVGSSARPSAVGFCCGALGATAFVTFAALWYQRLPMPDVSRFLLFAWMTTAATSGAVFSLAAWLALRLGSAERSRIALSLGVGAVGAIALATWAFHVIGRANRLFEVLAISVATLGFAVGLGLLAYVLSGIPLLRRRFGLAAIVLSAAVAVGLHATRVRDYEPPPPLTGSRTPPVKSPLASKPTNLLLVTVDTLRADHLSFYGYERDTSPHLRALADRSVVFEHAVSQRTFTAPSLATILTGTYPPTHKTRDNRSYLRATNVTLAELLKADGFRTAGATANPGLGPTFKFDQGFDSFEALEIHGEEAVYRQKPQEAKLMNELVFRALESVRNDRFFVWFHYMDPHGPYIPNDEYRDLYLHDDWSNRHAGAEVPPQTQQFVYGPILDDPFYQKRELDFYVSQYDAEIKYLDDELKRVFDLMSELGLWENTLVVFTADHGEAFGEHRGAYCQHYDPYYHTVHVPLLLSHPDLPVGSRIERTVSTVDIVPTVLDLLGLPPAPLAQGQSLAPLILNGDSAGTRPYQFSIGVGRPNYYTQAVRTDTHRLIMDFRRETIVLDALMEVLATAWVPRDLFNPYHYRSAVFELYDLQKDPAETRNIASEEPELVASLSEVLWSWIESSRYEGRHHDSMRADIDPETDETLRALGYVE